MKLNNFSRKRILCALPVLVLIGAAGWRAWVNSTPRIVIPAPPTAPNPNAYDFIVKATNVYVAEPDSLAEAGEPIFDPNHFAEFKANYPLADRVNWLNQNTKALQLVRQGFAYRSQYPLRTEQSGSKIRGLGKLLSSECHVRAIQGDWNGAAQSALDNIRLGNAYAPGGATIAYLVYSAMHGSGIRDLQALAEGLDAKNSREVARQLHELMRTAPTAADALTEEKWMKQQWLREVFSRPDWRTQFAKSYTYSQTTAMYAERVIGVGRSDEEDAAKLKEDFNKSQEIMRSLNQRQILANFNAVMDAAIAAAKQPYNQTKPARGKDFFSDIPVDILPSIRWSEARAHVRASLLETALVLRAYYLERGVYPDSLDALVPNYLPSVPHDTFTLDQPLHYRREGTTYKLWSIGPDSKDDGGQPVIDTTRQNLGQTLINSDSRGDFVYGFNH